MNVFDLLSCEDACSRLFRMVGGVYCPRCGSRRVKGHGNYGCGLKRYLCKACGRTFNDKTGTLFHYSRLSLREWFTLILLFLGLHNSCHSLSWLIDRSPMTVFKALRRLMLRFRDKACRVEFRGAVEVDELYVNAGFKGRCNSIRIKRLGRVSRRRAFRKRGRGLWIYDKPAIFILVGRCGCEDYVSSSKVESEAASKIIGRRVQEGSTIYTDNLESYMGLSELGYNHECVNHSEGEWVRGECHINNCENRASILRHWLAVHRDICKDNLSLYLAAFKACRRSRRTNPVQAIIETIKIIYVVVATKILLKSDN